MLIFAILCVDFCYVTFLALIPNCDGAILCDTDDEGKDKAPITLDSKDSKTVSMQDLASSEDEKEANIGGEEETKSSDHESMPVDNGAKDLQGNTSTKATVHEHEVTATSIEVTSQEHKATAQKAITPSTSTKVTFQVHEVTATSVEVTAQEHKATAQKASTSSTSTKATIQKHEVTATSVEVTAQEHTIEDSTAEEATAEELEEATSDIDGDNLKLSSFIPPGFRKRKAHSRPTHNEYDPVHLPKTRSGSK